MVVLIIPQENGVAKRVNRKILEWVKSMQILEGLPLYLLANIVNAIFYLINKGPYTALHGGSPHW